MTTYIWEGHLESICIKYHKTREFRLVSVCNLIFIFIDKNC